MFLKYYRQNKSLIKSFYCMPHHKYKNFLKTNRVNYKLEKLMKNLGGLLKSFKNNISKLMLTINLEI
jgi:hypothetical protein